MNAEAFEYERNGALTVINSDSRPRENILKLLSVKQKKL